jgi:FtsP/CotA-like multicopper oxidase with cupredoxin domain
MISRRDFLKLSGASAGAVYLATRARFLQRAYGATPQPLAPLPGSALPQFVDELPLLSSHVAGGAIQLVDGTVPLTIRMQEFKADMMPTGFVPAAGGTYAGTWVWGYQTDGYTTPNGPFGGLATYINPAVVATRHVPTKIKWVNELPTGAVSNTYWEDWTDLTLHWAHPEGEILNDHYRGPVPAVAHLHGGEVPPQLDGGPDAWFTPDGQQGHAYWGGLGGGGNSAVYNYPNTQEAAPIWFHDHALGITRINVYAGIAGAYLLLDPANAWPIDPTRIVPIVIQDRMFDVNGQLFFPNVGVNPEHPFWVPEFEGDVICVNGKVWPKLTLADKRYAFWFLNGSNARTYEFSLVDPVSDLPGPAMWVIGTDGGLLDAPVKIDPALAKLVMMPGERYLNTAKTPFPAGVAPGGTTTGRIMKFFVDPASTLPDEPYNPAGGGALRTAMVRLANPATGTPGAGVTIDKTRQLTLNEVMGAGGPLAALVNNSKWDGLRPDGVTPVNGGVLYPGNTYYTEEPVEGETELWEIVNITADAHPIHLHLVQFQLMNRQAFNVNKYMAAYDATFPGGVYIPEYGPPLAYDGSDPLSGGKLGGNPDVGALKKGGRPLYLQGPAKPPLPEEAGWKDTVIMYPGEVTRILVRWAPTDLAANTPAANAWFPFDPNGGHGYVWHCHIIDHEDNEMMRPDSVEPNPNATRTFTDY